MLSVGSYSADELNVAGSYTVTGTGSEIANLTTSAEGTISLGEGAELGVTNAEIAIANSAGTITAEDTIKLSGQVTGDGGNLTAESLDITAAAGSSVGTIDVGEIRFADITTPEAELNITDYESREGGIVLNFDNNRPASDIADGSYHLLASDGSIDGADFVVDSDYLQDLLKEGRTMVLETGTVEGIAPLGMGDNLFVNVRAENDGELTWYTSKENSEGGLYITKDDVDPTKLVYDYNTLQTIQHIVVDADQTIDLTAIAPDDEDGLNLRDLSGESKLSLIGDGDDLATIEGGNMQGGISLEKMAAVVSAPLTVGTFSGDSASSISGNITITKNGSYNGSYSDATRVHADGADLTIISDEKLALEGTNAVIRLNYGADNKLGSLHTTDSDVTLTGAPAAPLTLKEASSMDGGSLNFGVDTNDIGRDKNGTQVLKGTLALKGTQVNLRQANDGGYVLDVTNGLTTLATLDKTDAVGTIATISGTLLEKYFSNPRVENGRVVAERNTSYVTDKIRPTEHNSINGAAMLDELLVNNNPQVTRAITPTQAALMDAVDAGRMSESDAAAVAGSSLAVFGMAISGDMERQLRAIRNRTTSMGVNECVVNEGMPYVNAWVNAEGNHSELDSEGLNPGYKLDSWGGTVGLDIDFNPHLTMGVALTAMYGDLSTTVPDKMESDMDTYYVTLFARYASSAWTHTFVGAVGLMDGTMNRSVSAGGVNYETEGNLSGVSMGLMYEVGYVMPLDEDATACLQPIFNVMLRHTSAGSFTEEGSDAALDINGQAMTTLTFGLGARLQAVVGESIYNRASIFEGRVIGKLEVGDRQSDAALGFANSGYKGNVRSAELGAFGIEIGAGLTIPLGDDDGSLFMDASVELRSGYTNVNGTVGYRINF